MISTQRTPILRERTGTFNSISKNNMSRIRTPSVSSSILSNNDNASTTPKKSHSSLFSAFNLFTAHTQTSSPVTNTNATIPRTVPLPEPIQPIVMRSIVDIPLEKKIESPQSKSALESHAESELPLFMTFTNQGRCSLDSNISRTVTNSTYSSSQSSTFTSNPTKLSKSMVQFVYGSESTQLGLTPLQLNLPTDSRPIEPKQYTNPDKDGLFSIRITPFLESMSNTKSILFKPIIRKVGPNSQLVICRNNKHIQKSCSKISSEHHPICFDSNAISRLHGYLKLDQLGNWYIQDFKSASGTFLNHDRISSSNEISHDMILQNGDIVQLGMTSDDPNRSSENWKCVRMKIEINESWKLNQLQMNRVATERLTNLIDPQKEEICSICLYQCKPCQPIFLAPCAHCWHFNCIKSLMLKNYPHFVCPNCRAIIDLEEEIEEDD